MGRFSDLNFLGLNPRHALLLTVLTTTTARQFSTILFQITHRDQISFDSSGKGISKEEYQVSEVFVPNECQP